MNYFSSKNHVSWCCFLFKCKLTQKNSFILSFEQKASDFLKGRGKEKGKEKEKAEGKEKAGRERESRKEERESDAAELHRTQPHGRQKAKREGGGEKKRKKGKKERRESLAQDYWTRLWFTVGY